MLILRIIAAEIGHTCNIQPTVLTAVVSEDGINEAHVEPAKGPCVLSADPAIIFFHAFHVLRENDADKLADELVDKKVDNLVERMCEMEDEVGGGI